MISRIAKVERNAYDNFRDYINDERLHGRPSPVLTAISLKAESAGKKVKHCTISIQRYAEPTLISASGTRLKGRRVDTEKLVFQINLMH